jgi:hypothetical protein
MVVLGVVAVVGALVVSKPTPGGSAAGFHTPPRAKPFTAEQAATGATPIGRSATRSGLAGLPAADPSTLPTTATTAAAASSTTGTARPSAGTQPTGTGPTSAGTQPTAALSVTPTANSTQPAPAPVAVPGGDLAPAAAISLALSASAGTTTAHAEWAVTGGATSIAGFELVWSCCGVRQGSIQLPAGARGHDMGNLVPGASYVLQLSAIRLDGSVDAASVTTAPFTTTVAPTPAPATTVAPQPPAKPSPVPVTNTPVTEAPASSAPAVPATVKPRAQDYTLPGLVPRLIDRILLGGAQSDDDASNGSNQS